MKKRIAILMLTLLALLSSTGFVTTAIGLCTPRRHTASRTLRTGQPPETVWRAITDYENQPRWRGDVKQTVRLADRNGHEVWRETYEDGTEITLETTEAARPARLVRVIADEGGPFSGRWEYEIKAEGAGSLLTITEHGEVPNPFFRFVARYLLGHTYFMEKFEKDLAASFGEEAVIR